MKALLIAILLVATASASAQVHVRGYTKKDGTYVAPHMRSAPNHTTLDNYSTKGNINPYTGKPGTKDPEPYGSSFALPSISPAQQGQPTPQSQPDQQLTNPYTQPQPSNGQF